MLLKSLIPILLVALCGCAEDDSDASTTADQMVYFDLDTRSPIVSEPSEVVPAPHPVTGERSLMPGLYCSACRQWHPAPPLEELQRNPAARQCPQCAGEMSADGPWPEADAAQE